MAERESDQEVYDRQQAEREAAHAERRTRLGHETPGESKPKKSRSKAKKEEETTEPEPAEA